MPADITLSINKGLRYLAQCQLSNGGFESFSSPALQPFKTSCRYETVFVPAILLGALASFDIPEAQAIKQNLAQFLLNQKSERWSYNYWAKDTPEQVSHPYSDDLDDTFCALSSLATYDPELIQPEVLARIVKLLIATETKPGGPYKTWLVAPDSKKVWQDVDLAVNSNIAYFLSLVSEPLPNLTALMESAIRNARFRSPYYPGEAPLLYYLARAYQGPLTDNLADQAGRLLKKSNSVLEQALLTTVLIKLQRHTGLKSVVNNLIKSQLDDGSWAAEAFCIDPARDKQVHYHGAAALTTGLVLEAFNLYRLTDRRPSVSRLQVAAVSNEPILSAVDRNCTDLAPELKQSLKKILRATATGNNGSEIIGLPGHFNKSLLQPLQRSQRLLSELSLANLYGWAAYTIYDDFLDDEGKPELLSAANTAHRKSLLAFQRALPNSILFHELVLKTFDAIDGANAWELSHCRFQVKDGRIKIKKLPDFAKLEKLAERSLGHTLSPLGVLLATGHEPNGQPGQTILKALKHYLIARQLNDDAHDWQEDLEHGQITYVVTAILKDVGVKAGSYDLTKLTARMSKQFWHNTMLKVCDVMEFHLQSSRQAAVESGVLKQQNILTKMLDGIEKSIYKTRKTQAEAVNFLRHYEDI